MLQVEGKWYQKETWIIKNEERVMPGGGQIVPLQPQKQDAHWPSIWELLCLFGQQVTKW